jgi:hypothetical protein
MRDMRTAGRYLLVATLALPMACTGKNQATKVAIADRPGDAPAAGASPQVVETIERPPVEKIRIRASIDDPADIIAALSKLFALWQDPAKSNGQPTDLMPFLQATLLQSGFGPGFLEGLDLNGRFAADLAYPQPGQQDATQADLELAAVLSANDSKRVIESLPKSFEAQPVGGAVWEVRQGGAPMLMRANNRSVDVGLNGADLDRGHALLDSIPAGHRVRVHASNIPKDDLDPSQPLDLPDSIAKPISKLLREASAVEAAMDVGTDRDLLVVGAADAPFGTLGLGPLGPPIEAESKVAATLPANAAAAIDMPWGDPSLLHKQLDRLTPKDDDVPPPFEQLVGDTFSAMHGILDNIDGEVVSALYVSKKEQATLVLAAETKSDSAMRASSRKLLAALNSGFEQHIKATGGDKDHRYKVSYKPDGLVFSGTKADHFYVTVPKYLQTEMGRAANPYLGKKNPRLEVIVLIEDGRVFMTIGRGGKALISDISRKLGSDRATNLESDGGLALARRLDGGCHFCIALDPIELARLALIAARDTDDSRAAKEGLKNLAKLDLPGQIALAAKLEEDRGSLGLGIPKDMLFSEPEKLRALKQLFDDVVAPEPATTPGAKPAAKPSAAGGSKAKGARPKGQKLQKAK